MRHIFRKIKHFFRKNKEEIKESAKESAKESVINTVTIWGIISLWELSKIIFKK